MDNSAIEKIGRARLEELFSLTGIADPHIKSDEKTMSWDGNISIFSAEPFSKKTHLGDIPIQVKSHISDKFHTRFPVDMADLLIYKKEKRVFYLVMEMLSSNLYAYKLYYKSLYLLDIEKLIENNKGRNQITIDFDELPKEKPQDIAKILKLFLAEAKKQQVLIPGVLSLDDLHQVSRNGNLKIDLQLPVNFTVNDIIEGFEQQKPYIYFHNNELGLDFPVDRVKNGKLFVSQIQRTNIGVCNEVLYKEMEVIRSSNQVECKIGKCLSIYYKTDGVTYSFALCGDLSERIRASKLICGIYDESKIQTNCVDRHVSMSISEGKIDIIKKNLQFYLDIQKLFKKIGIYKELDFSIMTDDECKHLYFLIQSELYGRSVPIGYGDNRSGILKIANINILCSSKVDGDGFKLYSYFSNDAPAKWRYPDNLAPISQYLAFGFYNDLSLESVDNINFKEMCKQITSNKLARPDSDYCNKLVLRLLNFYDMHRDSLVIDTAIKISRHLYQSTKTDVDYLNFLQGLRRTRVLTEREKKQLITMRNKGSDLAIKCGCCILLEAKTEFNIYFSQLSKEDAEAFKQYPIMKLL